MGNGTDTQARILEWGRKEFLEKGFEKASLRTIASKAGVTTGAIYGYFPDKEAIFSALVEDTARGFMDLFFVGLHEFEQLPVKEQGQMMGYYSAQSMDWLIDYLYDHFTDFKLIICYSAGTKYEGFTDQIIELEEHYTWRFVERLQKEGAARTIPRDVAHILCSACYNGIFEVVEHDMAKEEAMENVRTLVEFFAAGWNRILGL